MLLVTGSWNDCLQYTEMFLFISYQKWTIQVSFLVEYSNSTSKDCLVLNKLDLIAMDKKKLLLTHNFNLKNFTKKHLRWLSLDRF